MVDFNPNEDKKLADSIEQEDRELGNWVEDIPYIFFPKGNNTCAGRTYFKCINNFLLCNDKACPKYIKKKFNSQNSLFLHSWNSIYTDNHTQKVSVSINGNLIGDGKDPFILAMIYDQCERLTKYLHNDETLKLRTKYINDDTKERVEKYKNFRDPKYAKVHYINFEPEDYQVPTKEELEQITKIVKETCVDLRRGDFINIPIAASEKNDGLLIYDGENVIDLSTEPDSYGTLPNIFKVLVPGDKPDNEPLLDVLATMIYNEKVPGQKLQRKPMAESKLIYKIAELARDIIPETYWHSPIYRSIYYNNFVWFDTKPYRDELLANVTLSNQLTDKIKCFPDKKAVLFTTCTLYDSSTLFMIWVDYPNDEREELFIDFLKGNRKENYEDLFDYIYENYEAEYIALKKAGYHILFASED